MILGIDPGIRKLGYALIDNEMNVVLADVIVLSQEKVQRSDYWQRMDTIYAFFEKLLLDYPSIELISMEKLYFTARNQNNAEFVYGIRGALMMLFHRHKITMKEYTPIQLKKYITGNSKASKDLVMKVVKRIFDMDTLPQYHDTADALGLAYLAAKQGF